MKLKYDTDALSKEIQELYDNNEITPTQYDDLMRYVCDL